MNLIKSKITVIFFDAVFSIFLELLTSFTKMKYERTMFLSVTSVSDVTTDDVPFLIVLPILFAFISDNITGRYFPALAGLLCLFIPVLSVFSIYEYVSENILKTILEYSTRCYISTCVARDLVILEHLDIQNELVYLRFYVFFIIYMRMASIALVYFMYISFDKNTWFMIVRYSSMIIVTLYFNLFIIYGCVLNTVNIYFNIWIKMISCFIQSIKSATEINLNPSVRGLKTKKAFFGFRLGRESITSTEIQEDEEEKEKKKCLKLRLFFEEMKKRGPVEQEETINEEDRNHWFSNSRPAATEYVVYHTIRFTRILPFILIGLSFSICNYFVHIMTMIQAQVCRRSADYFLHIFDLKSWVLIFCLFLYPLVEFIIYPLSIDKVKRNLNYFFIGYCFLLLSSLFMTFVQMNLVLETPYFPSPRNGQVRIYSEWPDEVTIEGLSTDLTKVKPFGYAFIPNIYVQGVATKLATVNRGVSKDIIRIEIVEKRTVSYVYIENRLIRTGQVDPTVFEKQKNHHLSKIMFVSSLPLSVISNFESSDRLVVKPINGSSTATSLLPDTYDILLTDGPTSSSILDLPDVKLNPGVLTSVFLVKYINGSIEGYKFDLEGPISTPYSVLFYQVFSACLGNAIAHVSFFRFLFKECPHVVRTGVFTIIYVGHVSISAASNSFYAQKQIHGNWLITMIISTIVHIFIVVGGFILSRKYSHRFPY